MSSIGVPAASSSRTQEVLDLAVAQRLDAGSSVGPSTPQFQLRLSSDAVAVVLAVRLVVLVVERDQIVQGEAVMAA